MITQLEMFLNEARLELTLPELMESDIKQANIMEILDEQIGEATAECELEDTLTVLETTIPHLIRLIRAKAQLQGKRVFINWQENQPDQHNTVEGLFQDYGLWAGMSYTAVIEPRNTAGDVDVSPIMYLDETSAFAELPPVGLAEEFLCRFYPVETAKESINRIYGVVDATYPEVVCMYVIFPDDLHNSERGWSWLSGKKIVQPAGADFILASDFLESDAMLDLWEKFGSADSQSWDIGNRTQQSLPDGRLLVIESV